MSPSPMRPIPYRRENGTEASVVIIQVGLILVAGNLVFRKKWGTLRLRQDLSETPYLLLPRQVLQYYVEMIGLPLPASAE